MAPFVFQRVTFFFVSRRPPALAPSREVEVVADPSRTRAGAGDRRARRRPAGRPPPAVAQHVSGPAPGPRAGPQRTAMPGHGPRTTRRPARVDDNGQRQDHGRTRPRPRRPPAAGRAARKSQHATTRGAGSGERRTVRAGNEPRNDTARRAGKPRHARQHLSSYTWRTCTRFHARALHTSKQWHTPE